MTSRPAITVGAVALTTVATFTTVARDSSACGGPFGPGYTVTEQKILATHRDDTERYVFQPYFCGESESFGLVLPVPAALSENPALAPKELFANLEALAAPKVVKKTECKSRQTDGNFGGGSADAGAPKGVDVIGVGQVGIFDWALLQATTAASFTDWLDANGYPHDATSDALFSHYVDKGWYFVAFKVSAASSAPTGGKKLCGDLGPIKLAFPATAPVVPARIAAAGALGNVTWDVYTAASGSALTPPSSVASLARFSGDLSATQISARPAVAGLLQSGDHFSRYQMTLAPSALADDLTFAVSAKQSIQETRYDITYVDCEEDAGVPTPAPSGSSPGGGPSSGGAEATPGDAPPAAKSDSGCAAAPSGTSRSAALGVMIAGAVAALVRRRRPRR